MQQVIIAIHLMVVIALVALVLYQKSEGSALGLGQSGLFSGRGQANALTRATSILGTIFFITSVLLTILPAWERRAAGGADWTTAVDSNKVQIKEIKPAPGAAPDAAKGRSAPDENESIFEQLKRAQEKRQAAPPSLTAPAPGAEAPAPVPPAAPPPQSNLSPESKPALRPTSEPNAAPKVESAPVAQPAAPAEPKAAPAGSWTAPAELRTAPTEPKAAPMEPKAAPTEPKAAPVEPKAATEPAKPSAEPPPIHWTAPTK